jgi:haloalkane dehalogenase
MEILRTPPERFEGLPDFPFEARYHQWGDLRLAHLDEGEGPPILLLHGQPTWSFLFRKSIQPLVDAGYRCVAFDYPGFGRSDKPADVDWYSFEHHIAAVGSLIEELDLRDLTVLGHDWGGPIGLRVATGPLRDRVSRMVAMDTTVLTGQDLGEAWRTFRDLVASREDLPTGRVVRMACRTRLPREVVAAYEAPFPDPSYKAGVKAFPRLIPLREDDPTAIAGQETLAVLRDDPRPALVLWAERDVMFPREECAPWLHSVFGNAEGPIVVEDTGHFMFEDRPDRIADLLASWLDEERAGGRAQALPPSAPVSRSPAET